MVPRRPPRPCYWTAPPGGVYALTADRRQIASRWAGMDPRQGAHLHPYIHYYNRAAVLPCTASGVAVVSLVSVEGRRLTVCPPTCRRQRYIRFCLSGIVGGRMGQIAGKAPANPCALFYGVGGIVALTVQNTL